LLVEGQMRSIAVALLIDLLLLSLLLKSVRSGLISLLPVAFSVLLMFAILAVTGIPLGIANSMFAGIAIGIGLDFAIRLTAADRQARASGLSAKDSSRDVFMSTAPAIVISAGAIAAGFSVLLFSQITPNVQLGLMTCLSLTISAVVTLILAPSLMLVWRLSNSREK
jgi:predicted RND superfamily exporter protein